MSIDHDYEVYKTSTIDQGKLWNLWKHWDTNRIMGTIWWNSGFGFYRILGKHWGIDWQTQDVGRYKAI